jgi:hypothetical protein
LDGAGRGLFHNAMSQAAANPLDPKSLLEQAFEMEDEFPGPAEDLLLSWLLSLGSDQVPAEAAAALLPRYSGRVEGKDDALPIVKLHRLLEQVAISPPATARRGRLSARTRRGS